MSSENTDTVSVNTEEVVEKTTEQVQEQVPEQVQVNLNDLTALQAVDVIYKLLNKAASRGVYSIDESHALKILVTKVVMQLNQS